MQNIYIYILGLRIFKRLIFMSVQKKETYVLFQKVLISKCITLYFDSLKLVNMLAITMRVQLKYFNLTYHRFKIHYYERRKYTKQ